MNEWMKYKHVALSFQMNNEWSGEFFSSYFYFFLFSGNIYKIAIDFNFLEKKRCWFLQVSSFVLMSGIFQMFNSDFAIISCDQ